MNFDLIKNSKLKIENFDRLGQSLFEVVVAVGISAIIIVGVVSLVTSSIRNATFSKNKSLASKYAQSGIEWLRAQRDADPTIFGVNASTSRWCLIDLSFSYSRICDQSSDFITDTIFVRDLTFTTSAVSGKNIINAKIVVSWADSLGTHATTSETQFSDWRQR